MTAWYNEIDPFAAAWLRELIAAGQIAPGIVDERDIRDVAPADLRGFRQCHFFAGIGVWSFALRQAGWPDHKAVWTGSCPCQPFSVAGAGTGTADVRHLWPFWHWLIGERRPAVVLGEQVASKAAGQWLDLVQADLEALGYAVGAVAFPAAGVGAPHIRDRLWWVADAGRDGRQNQQGKSREQASAGQRRHQPVNGGSDGRLADADRGRLQARQRHGAAAGHRLSVAADRGAERLADSDGGGRGELAAIGSPDRGGQGRHPDLRQRDGRLADAARERPARDEGGGWQAEPRPEQLGQTGRPGAADGFWRAADWLCCRDGKWRPVEPGTFPLADGAAARVGRLRGYGNALNAEAAKAFIEAVISL